MKRQSSAKGFTILSIASIFCKLLAFVYLPIQAILVQDVGNGVISAGYKLYAFIYNLTNAGFPVLISKFIAERVELGDYRSTRLIFRNAFRLMLSFGIIATLFTYFGSDFLARWCGMSEAKLMFMCIAPSFLFTSISCSLRGYFQGRSNMTPTAVSQIIDQIVNSAMTVALEIYFFHYAQRMDKNPITYTAAGSALATVLAAAASAVFLGFIFLFVLRRQRKEECRRQEYDGDTVTSGSVYRRMLRFSIPALISCIAASAVDIIDTHSCVSLLIKTGFTSAQAYALFGIYSTKFQRLLTLTMLFVVPLVTTMMPALSAARVRGDRKYLIQKARLVYRLNFTVVFPIIAGMTFLAKPIVTFIFTSQNSGSQMLILGTWTALLMTTQSIQSGLLIALDRPSIAPVTMLIGMIAKTLCNYLLIPIHALNIYGALIGNVAAWAIAVTLNHHFIQQALNGRVRVLRYTAVPGLMSAVMGGLCLGVYTLLHLLFGLIWDRMLLVNALALLPSILFGALVYLKLMAWIGAIGPEDIRMLPMSGRIGRFLFKTSRENEG